MVSRNRYNLSAIVDAIKFLAVNELLFRGKEENLGSLHSGLFLQLMEFSFKDKKLLQISRSIPNNAKYTCVQKSKMMYLKL